MTSKCLPSPLLSFVKTFENSVFSIHDNNSIKLLTPLRLNFNHLNEHKFRQNFLDTINPISRCGCEPENTVHFLLDQKTQSTFSCTGKHSPLSLERENTVHFLLNQKTQSTFSWTRKHSPLSFEPENTVHFLLNQKTQSTFSWTRKHSPFSKSCNEYIKTPQKCIQPRSNSTKLWWWPLNTYPSLCK